MPNSKHIIHFYADSKTSDVLKSYWDTQGFDTPCQFHGPTGEDEITLRYTDNTLNYTMPVRLGVILDEITHIKSQISGAEKSVIQFKEGTLDTHRGIFKRNSNDISLTEKETALLNFLYQQKGRVISKENLLREVWNYADDVETHTLETHIYRLRQKIEINPAEPKILITDGNGYRVN